MFFRSHLFYSLATLIHLGVPNIVLIIKVSSFILLASLALTTFLFAKKVLKWSDFKSFLVALLIACYFVSLRNSWDLYSQTLGLSFLFATFIALGHFQRNSKHILAFVFMILTILSHELIAVILFAVLGFEMVHLLMQQKKKDSTYLSICGGLALLLFIFTHYSADSPIGLAMPPVATATEASISLALFIAGFVAYCYVLLAPLAIVGFIKLRNWTLRFWVIFCFTIIVICMVFPNSPLFYWNRWVLLLVYPLLFFTIDGLDRIWTIKLLTRVRARRLIPKLFVIIYLALLLSLSGFYLVVSPQNQISFFSNNSYLTFIPSSMLQNTLPLSDNPSVTQCFDWINNNADENSIIVLHYAVYDLGIMYIENRSLVPIGGDYGNVSMWNYIQNKSVLADTLVSVSKAEIHDGHSMAYTVWWTPRKGWYDIPSLPSCFQQVYIWENMAVYSYNSTT
jgi:hypothetical protein